VVNAWRKKMDLPMPVYKGRDGRRSGVVVISEGEVEGLQPMALGAACACTNLRSRRGDGFGIIIAKTRGACVIAII
jgi:hypothetical protein